MSSIISALFLNNNAQHSLSEWIRDHNVLAGRLAWVDSYLKAPLHQLIFLNETTLWFADAHPTLFALAVLFAIYAATLLLAAGTHLSVRWLRKTLAGKPKQA